MKITETKADVFHFSKIDGHCTWAIFMVHEPSGTLCIESDWGNWAFRWGSHGRDSLKHFIAEGDHGYFKNKLSYGTDPYFYLEDTENQIKRDILRAFRKRQIDKDEARGFYDELEEIYIHKNGQLFLDRFYQTECFEKLYDSDYTSVPFVTGYEPALEALFKHAWPLFVEHMQDILKAAEVPEHGQAQGTSEASSQGASSTGIG